MMDGVILVGVMDDVMVLRVMAVMVALVIIMDGIIMVGDHVDFIGSLLYECVTRTPSDGGHGYEEDRSHDDDGR